MQVANIARSIEAQPIDAIVLNPHERIVTNILADLSPPVIGTRLAPGRLRSLVVVEVDAAPVVLAPPVESPQIQVGRAKMVVDHIDNHGDTQFVGPADEVAKGGRGAVVTLDSEDL